MSAAQPFPTDAHTAPDPAANDDAYYRRTLHQFIDIATALAQPLPNDATLPADKRAEAFERISRALRRTILLARHIAEHPPRQAAAQRTIARKRIIRAVDDAIATSADETQAESLRQELCERLDAPDFDDDITNRPIEQIINEIRRDLGLANIQGAQPWPRRTPECLVSLAALAAAAQGEAAPMFAADDLPEPTPPVRPAPPPHPRADPEPRPESLLDALLRRAPVRDG